MKMELFQKKLLRIIGEHFRRYAHALRFAIDYMVPRLAPMWQQSGTLLFCSCHGIAGFFVDELQI